MKVLLVAADPTLRDSMAVTLGSLERVTGEAVQVLRARDGLDGIALAWRHMPQVVMADEITSRAGAFALTKELKGATTPFPGAIVILLDRSEDAWLASWAGADAWFVKPVNPFDLADTLAGLISSEREEAV